MRILFADDDGLTRAFVSRVLRGLGHEGEGVEGMAALLRRCDEALPDAVLCDVCMPDGDGIEACQRLRERYVGLPIVIMTGDPRSAERARRSGFKSVLEKPFDSEQLGAAIAELKSSGGGSQRTRQQQQLYRRA